MLQIERITIEHTERPIVTDRKDPSISFSLSSDRSNCVLKEYRITVRDGDTLMWDSGICTDQRQIGIHYAGAPLQPFHGYTVEVFAVDNYGETASKRASFTAGRLDTPWQAKWITDYTATAPKKSSPPPLLFRKKISVKEPPVRAWINAAALGIYEIKLNGSKLGDRYFAPGFTSYLHQMQYQTYAVETLNVGTNLLSVTVGGGWAVGAFTYSRKNRTYTDTPSLLLELRMVFLDGTEEIIGTDSSWLVTQGGRLRFADWYDGEIFDATVDEEQAAYKNADVTRPRKAPMLLAEYGDPVRTIGELHPTLLHRTKAGERIYDFGQNFAGVIAAELQGEKGQKIIFRHAEVLVDGELFTKPLRTAKATLQYTCADGPQFYSPTMTYMGFRYVGVTGIDADKLSLKAYVLSSDLEAVGSFTCSNEKINRLQQNIVWGGRSNFIDIPTDCPQRDERMGWTGDISVFARTASFNFDMSRFLDKWLLDLKTEQGRGGGIPMTIPQAGDTWPVMATSCWGDCCITVPWAEYLARGDLDLLRRQYPTMKRFLKAAKWWAGWCAIGRNKRRIWRFPFHFGDWCAPGETAREWKRKGPWVATAYFANSCKIVAEIARLLEDPKDAAYYQNLFEEICEAYRAEFTDGTGKLKNEFQTAYVLPLYFEMASLSEQAVMVKRLCRLVEDADCHLTTGFTGTPYLLFALSDHGKTDMAYRLLLQDTCPSWLYEVKAGGTTIWERWDALRPDGTVELGQRSDSEKDAGMVSFNHYANGAVGDWLYRRVAGIEALEVGYKTFRIAPLPGGGLRFVKASVRTAYGQIRSAWRIESDTFALQIQIPVSTKCYVRLPDGSGRAVGSGTYEFSCCLSPEAGSFFGETGRWEK